MQQQTEEEDDEYDEFDAEADAMEEAAASWTSADNARIGVAAAKPDGEESFTDHADPLLSHPSTHPPALTATPL